MRAALFLCATMLCAMVVDMPVVYGDDPSVVRRTISLWSNGTRLTGDIYYPVDAGDDTPYPTIVMAHGWGGERNHLNSNYAPKIADAGFIVLTFDYRGWGASDGRMIMIGPQPAANGKGEMLARVRKIREVVDPIDQMEDITSVLDYLMGEAMVDKRRIGLWGTSYGGGMVLQIAAQDRRVAAVVAQAAFMGGDRQAERVRQGQIRAVEQARGEIEPIPQEVDQIWGLRGTPDFARMLNYTPIDHAEDVTVPTMIIDMADDELFDRMKNGHAVYNIVSQNAPAEYHVLPGKHYDIYETHREASTDLAIAWFAEHLGSR